MDSHNNQRAVYGMIMISNTYYEVGDEVVVEILDNPEDRYSSRRQVKMLIIGESREYENNTYLCYVPPYETHPRATLIDKKLLRTYHACDEYLNERGVVINDWTDVYKHILRRSGCSCDDCGEFFDYAERDKDGEFRCWSCKQDPFRRSF